MSEILRQKRLNRCPEVEFVFHFGYPKTGTTSLQHFLGGNQKKLRAKGIFYPLSKTVYQKHGFLVGLINNMDSQGIEEYFLGILDKIEPSDNKVVFSIEGVGFNTYFFQDEKLKMFCEILNSLNSRVVFYLRESYSFLWSWYKQSLINPPNNPIVSVFGESMSLLEMTSKKETLFLIDYLRFIKTWKNFINQDRIIFEELSKDVISQFCNILKVNPDDFTVTERRNYSISDSGAYFFYKHNSSLKSNKKLRSILILNKEKIFVSGAEDFRNYSFSFLPKQVLDTLDLSNSFFTNKKQKSNTKFNRDFKPISELVSFLDIIKPYLSYD